MPNEELVRLMLGSRGRQGKEQGIVSHESALAAYGLSPEHLQSATREALQRDLVSALALERALTQAPPGIQRRFEAAGLM